MPERPNILLITTDQQRYDSLGSYGAPGVHTPNLDRLAAEGTRYDQCYCTNPICTPSRASMWTGKHLPGHEVYQVHDCLPHDEVFFSERLRDAGYDTALFGKVHVSGHVEETERRHPHDGFRLYEWTPDPTGFKDYDTAYKDWLAEHHPEVLKRIREKGPKFGHLEVSEHLTTWAADRTIAYLEKDRDAGKPFFCCMSVFDPHNPYCNHPKEMEELISIDALAPIVDPTPEFAARPAAHALEHEFSYVARYRDLSAQELHEWRVGYHAAVVLIDMQVGRVLEALEREGLAENTLVLFTSDHGDMLGDHGLLVKGCFFYDPCTRVPLILRGPGIAPGMTENGLCQLHDVAATCLLAAGLDADDVTQWMPDARDLRSGAALASRGFAACLHRNSGITINHDTKAKGYFDPPLHGTMWREGKWKLNVYHSPKAGPGQPAGELFDMEADPLEMTNLWDDPAHAGIRNELHVRLLDWLVSQEVNSRSRARSAAPF